MASRKKVYRPYIATAKTHYVVAQLYEIMEQRGLLFKSIITSRENAYRWFSGKGVPTLNSLDRVLEPMGLTLQIVERKQE